MIKTIDAMLEALADWQAGHLAQSAIGYPTMSPEARAAQGSYMGSAPLHAISPEVMMPRHIAEIDKLVRTAPVGMQGLFERHYMLRKQSPSGAYWVRLDRMHWYLAGKWGLDYWPEPRSERQSAAAAPSSTDEPTVLDRAVDWLGKYLAAHQGQEYKRQIMQDGGKAGFSARTIYRAQVELGVTYSVSAIAGERRSVWVLSVPNLTQS